jgi:diaminopimelate decarboxylase
MIMMSTRPKNSIISNGCRVAKALFKALNTREKTLPDRMLKPYLKKILEKKEALLVSASRFSTPQYFFDEPSLAHKTVQFLEAFSRHLNRCRVFYAMKSNSFFEICRRVTAKGVGLDVSSAMELAKALSLNCQEIIFSGPGKTDEELRFAIQHRSRVTLLMDSFGELQRLSEILKRDSIQGYPLRAGIRVQHQGGWSKFGIPLNDLGLFLKRAGEVHGLDPCGIQIHSSWNLDPAPQVEMIYRIGTHLRRRMPTGLSKSLKFLDIGGGFWPEEGEWFNAQNTLWGRLIQAVDPGFEFGPGHYYHKACSIEGFAEQIAGAYSHQGPPLCNLELWMEPGRWLSHSAMHILLRVVDKKGEDMVITDGGTNLLGWERPMSEFIPVINLSRPSLTERRVRVFGSLCTPYDIWGYSVFGEDVRVGDVLVVPDQGAYTYSLRQSFIKPRARVIRYDGDYLKEVEEEEHPKNFGIRSSSVRKSGTHSS